MQTGMKIKDITRSKFSKTTLTIIKLLFVFLPLLIITHYLQGSWYQLSQHLALIDWRLVIIAWIFFVIYYLARSLSWKLLINNLGQPLDWKSANHVWFWSELSRYLPGNIWSMLGRVYLGQQQGIPKKTVATSLLLEIIFLVRGASVFFSFFWGLLPYHNSSLAHWLWLIVIPIIVLLVSPNLLIGLINKLLKLLKKSPLSLSLRRLNLLGLLLLYLLGWCSYGIASLITLKALIGPINVSIFWMVSAFVIAWLIGYLSLITPMGLGVREAAAVVILSPIISAGAASMVAIATRVMVILSELSILAVLAIVRLNLRSAFKSVTGLVKKYWPELILIIASIAFFVFFSAYSVARQNNFTTGQFDLGIMDQVVWNTAHGHFFQLTQPGGTTTISRFDIHADLLLAIISPLYWIVSSAKTLLILQVLVIVLAVIPLYLLGKDFLKNRQLAMMIGLLYLLYPPMQHAIGFDFHPVTLATSLIIFTFYFLYRRQYWWYAIFAILTVSTKETAALSVIMLGVYALIIKRDRLVGWLTIFLNMAWIYILLWQIMPHFRGSGEQNASAFLLYYSQFGSTPGQILHTIFFRPEAWLKYLFTRNNIRYLGQLLLPLAFIPVASPIILLAIPELLINTLSNNPHMTTISFQYTSIVTAFVFLAFIFGLRNLLNLWKKPHQLKMATTVIVISLVLCSLFSFRQWSIISPFRINYYSVFTDNLSPSATAEVNYLAQTIPSADSVSATETILPHFDERAHAYLAPAGFNLADYIIIRPGDDPQLTVPLSLLQTKTTSLAGNHNFSLIFKTNDLLVYRKDSHD